MSLNKIKDINFSKRMKLSDDIRNNKELVKNNILLKDISFKSPSTAANFVSDAVCNGLRYWRTEKGITLKDYLSEEK